MKTTLQKYLESLPPLAAEFAQGYYFSLSLRPAVTKGLSESERGAIGSALDEIKRNFPDEIPSGLQKTQGTK